jgi:hypothetical protein
MPRGNGIGDRFTPTVEMHSAGKVSAWNVEAG